MMHNHRGLLLLPLLSGILFAAEPFHLRFPDLTQGWYPSGAVARVPGDRITRLEVRLDQEAASQVQMETITLTLDGQYPKFTRARNSEGYLLTVTSREPLGLLVDVDKEHQIEVSATGQHPYKGEWTIVRWDKVYVQSTMVGPHNNAIGIRIDQPPGGVVLVALGSGLARLSGEILGNCDCRLTIAGQQVRRLAAKPGFQFEVRVPVPPKTREISVSAKDETGANMTVLYLPVLWPSGKINAGI